MKTIQAKFKSADITSNDRCVSILSRNTTCTLKITCYFEVLNKLDLLKLLNISKYKKYVSEFLSNGLASAIFPKVYKLVMLILTIPIIRIQAERDSFCLK